MSRLFEFNDLDVTPRWYHICLREFLSVSYNTFKFYNLWKNAVTGFLLKRNEFEVIDIGSGEMGPTPLILGIKDSERFKVTLSDIRPQPEHIEYVNQLGLSNLKYYPKSLNAADIPSEFDQPRMIVNAFHHFDEELVKSVIDDSIKKKQALIVLEYVSRSPLVVLSIAVTSIVFPFLFFPFYKNKSLSIFLFTYLIPLVPLMILWDGMVSCIRWYSPKKIKKIISQREDRENIATEFGVKKGIENLAGVNWTIIYPKE